MSERTCQSTGLPKGVKRPGGKKVESERPQKRLKALLDEDDTSSEDDNSISDAGGISFESGNPSSNRFDFTINEEYARRFEYTKKREELQRLEEKYGKSSAPGSSGNGTLPPDDEHGSADSSSDEEEDEEGILASETLDAQIQNTIEAIRRKDPRVYDKQVTFYTKPEEAAQDDVDSIKRQEKPMFLSDYHRNNLLEEAATLDTPDDEISSYAQQQDDLKNVIVKEMHAAAYEIQDQNDEEDDDGFLVPKSIERGTEVRTGKGDEKARDLAAEAADRDPEAFLSKFMSARAWIPSGDSNFQAIESDEEEEERRADLFEEAYNLRFEDPKASNEKLLSHARDAAARYSVRKEFLNPRKRAREAERANKEAERQTREGDRARLRKLKVAEAEEKLRKIKDAAGLRGKSLQKFDWLMFLDECWDNVSWEEEMKKRFGDDYYADHDSDGSNGKQDLGKRKLKKPKWEDDIDVDDLVPDFDVKEDGFQHLEPTDDDSEGPGAAVEGNEGSAGESTQVNVERSSEFESNQKRERDEQKKTARQERRRIQQLVDQRMDAEENLSNLGRKSAGFFRYRETSPTAYGLTAQDILMASDSQLNQYAGLKKMATFRDPERKKKDKKRLGKKARLRQWRKETFGNEQGPQKTLVELLAGQDVIDSRDTKASDGIELLGGKKKKRSRKSKGPVSS